MEKHFTFPVKECYGFGDKYGKRSGGDFHGGIDMSWWNDPNTPLYAVKSGLIVWSGYTTYGGNVIALEINNGSTKQWCLYQHCNEAVAYPREVKQGEVVGNMGNTGHSSGYHLHFTMCEDVPLSMNFSYQYAINHTIDPYEHILYRLKGLKYTLNDKPHTGGQGSVDLKKIVEFTNDSKEDDVFALLDELTQKLKEMNKTIQKIEDIL